MRFLLCKAAGIVSCPEDFAEEEACEGMPEDEMSKYKVIFEYVLNTNADTNRSKGIRMNYLLNFLRSEFISNPPLIGEFDYY